MKALFDLPFRSWRNPEPFAELFDSAEARAGWFDAAATDVPGFLSAEAFDGSVVFGAAVLEDSADPDGLRALRCFSADVGDPVVELDRLPIVNDDGGRDVLEPDDELKRLPNELLPEPYERDGAGGGV